MKGIRLFTLGATLLASSAAFAFPEIGSFDGYYNFKAADYTFNGPEVYANFFPQEFRFQIETVYTTNAATNEVIPVITIRDFLYAGTPTTAEYNAETGVLTYKVITLQPVGSEWLAISPDEGEWGGISALTGNPLKMKIAEDGSVSIPGFAVGPYDGKTGLTAEVVAYDDITVTQTAPPEVIPERNFEGTYPLKGERTDYNSEGDSGPYPFDFDLVINKNNQVTSIGGYVLTQQEIKNGWNYGKGEGNSLVLSTSFFTLVAQKQVQSPDPNSEDGYTDSYLLGGENTKRWESGDKIVFTLNDEDPENITYTLSPFTVWHRYQIYNEEYETTSFVTELVFKWTQTGIGSGIGVPEMEATNEAPRYYNLQGVEVKNPAKGEILIRVANGKAVKIKK